MDWAQLPEAKINTYSQSSYWGELVETFVLFGDPATDWEPKMRR